MTRDLACLTWTSFVVGRKNRSLADRRTPPPLLTYHCNTLTRRKESQACAPSPYWRRTGASPLHWSPSRRSIASGGSMML